MQHSPLSILQNTFHLENFREWQEEIVQCVLSGQNVLVLMPTGGGKSLTYQIPALCLSGLTIVISPLISLMKDQVDKLQSLGIRTEVINSHKSPEEIDEILYELQFNDEAVNPIKLLYIAPERLQSGKFLQRLSDISISLLAIDEAHCISQWWHDFRTSYLKIKDFVKFLKIQERKISIMALTATATQKVRRDIIDCLELKEYKTFISGFNRPNITIVVREISKKDEKLEKILDLVNSTPGAGIVYCSTISHVEDVYDFLKRRWVSCGIYTGATSADLREANQNNFMSDDIKVIVATNAFGMGIDKKDIRFVIHYNLPGSIESYYQEAGRAWRDGKRSYSVILASYQDTKIQEYFIQNTHPDKKDILAFYDYIYRGFQLSEGTGNTILKTYSVMAEESSVGNEFQIGSMIKILEKYAVIRRGVNADDAENFRGRGITLLLEKMSHEKLPINWSKEEMLRKESYQKLEAIKKLLFSPHCRKKHILNYFGDEIDAAEMEDGCGSCDFCLGLSVEKSSQGEECVVPISSLELVLETVERYDEKYGSGTIRDLLYGSRSKQMLKYDLMKDPNFGIFSDYPMSTIDAIFQWLEKNGYLEKTFGLYPKIRLTEKGQEALINETILKEDTEITVTVPVKNVKKTGEKKEIAKKVDTKKETLALFRHGLSIERIASDRELTIQTIQWHLADLLSSGDIKLEELSPLINTDGIHDIKNAALKASGTGLKELKEYCEKGMGREISYFELKIALAIK